MENPRVSNYPGQSGCSVTSLLRALFSLVGLHGAMCQDNCTLFLFWRLDVCRDYRRTWWVVQRCISAIVYRIAVMQKKKKIIIILVLLGSNHIDKMEKPH